MQCSTLMTPREFQGIIKNLFLFFEPSTSHTQSHVFWLDIECFVVEIRSANEKFDITTHMLQMLTQLTVTLAFSSSYFRLNCVCVYLSDRKNEDQAHISTHIWLLSQSILFKISIYDIVSLIYLLLLDTQTHCFAIST